MCVAPISKALPKVSFLFTKVQHIASGVIVLVQKNPRGNSNFVNQATYCPLKKYQYIFFFCVQLETARIYQLEMHVLDHCSMAVKC